MRRAAKEVDGYELSVEGEKRQDIGLFVSGAAPPG
jgi:hypothetical protein